jgi:hypothetical protein
MPSIVLIDGFTNGTWKITRQGASAVLTIRPFASISHEDTEALTAEGLGLLDFAAADASTREIRFEPPVGG